MIEDALFAATTLALVAVDEVPVAIVFAVAAFGGSGLNAWTETMERR